MGFFDKAKDLYNLQKQAKQVTEDLKKTHVEAESDGVTVTVDGKQEVLSVKIAEGTVLEPKKLENAFKDASNRALKKSQDIAAEKMKVVMNGMGMGNMMGTK